MGRHEAEPTQVRHPWRAAVRTAIQAAIPTLTALWGLVLILPAIADAVAQVDGVPGWLTAALTAGAGVCAVLAGIVARIMAIPAVNEWIAKHLPALGTGDQEPRG